MGWRSALPARGQHTDSAVTRIAWKLKEKEIVKEQPGIDARQVPIQPVAASFEKEWGHEYHRPGLKTRVLAFMLRIVPKVGPFRRLPSRLSTQQTERMFELELQSDAGTIPQPDAAAAGEKIELKDDKPGYG